MPLKPLNHQVIVQRVEDPETRALLRNSLILPGEEQGQAPIECIVVSAGKDVKDLDAGDYVIVKHFRGIELVLDAQKAWVCHPELDIVCIIEAP